MIIGRVTPNREATIVLRVFGQAGREREIEAVIDTGFDNWLTLPAAMIKHLGLPWQQRTGATLADGSKTEFDVYLATVLWDKAQRRIPVHAAETTPLLGMGMLEGFELNMRVRSGGKVSIKRLRP
jgi:clan AA aspartic protease